jgi:hypothetical protein
MFPLVTQFRINVASAGVTVDLIYAVFMRPR